MPALPKVVKKKSSKKDLWAELQAARDEIEQQQVFINHLQEKYNRAVAAHESTLDGVRVIQNQLKTIRSLVALEINFYDPKTGEQRG